MNTKVETKALTRTERKKIRTRYQLVEAAHGLMSQKGVDGTTIAEITDAADIGFGTFYNYYDSKDGLAAHVLDCLIDDLGRRNDLATADLKKIHPAAVQAISIRLTMREMLTNIVWMWWCKRPALLVQRVHQGLHRYGARDLRLAIEAGRYDLDLDEVETAWSQQIWMLVGGVRDLLEGQIQDMDETRLVQAILRSIGLPPERAAELARLDLPKVPARDIDFSFSLQPDG